MRIDAVQYSVDRIKASSIHQPGCGNSRGEGEVVTHQLLIVARNLEGEGICLLEKHQIALRRFHGCDCDIVRNAILTGHDEQVTEPQWT